MEQLLQNIFWTQAEDQRLPKRQANLFRIKAFRPSSGRTEFPTTCWWPCFITSFIRWLRKMTVLNSRNSAFTLLGFLSSCSGSSRQGNSIKFSTHCCLTNMFRFYRGVSSRIQLGWEKKKEQPKTLRPAGKRVMKTDEVTEEEDEEIKEIKRFFFFFFWRPLSNSKCHLSCLKSFQDFFPSSP